MPIIIAGYITKNIDYKDTISVYFLTGEINDKTQVKTYQAKPFSKVQREIYERGGMLEE